MKYRIIYNLLIKNKNIKKLFNNIYIICLINFYNSIFNTIKIYLIIFKIISFVFLNNKFNILYKKIKYLIYK